jgi:hypothetical protein
MDKSEGYVLEYKRRRLQMSRYRFLKAMVEAKFFGINRVDATTQANDEPLLLLRLSV